MDPRPLRNLPVAVLDFETTALPDADPHVVSGAVVHATLGDPDSIRLAWSSLVRPPVSIPDSASRIHGITDADVADAPAWSDVAEAFEAACAGRVVVAYNAPADFVFHHAEQARAGRAPLAWPWLCLLVVRKATVTRGAPGKLREIAGAHGIAVDAHGSAGDALTTAMLLDPLMREAWGAGAFTGPGGARAFYDRQRGWDNDNEDHADEDYSEDEPEKITTIEAVFRWQREAALYQERDFCNYARRQGWRSRPSCAWHEIEGVEPPPWPAAVRTAPCSSCGAATVRKVAKDGSMFLADPATGEAHACARSAS